MKSLFHRASVFLLALLMALSCLPAPALAAEADAELPEAVSTETPEEPAEEPAAEPEAPAEEPAAEPEAPAEEPAAEPEAPAEEPAAEPEAPAEEPAAEPEAPAEEPAAEPEAPSEEPAAEPETPAEEPAAEPEAPAEEPAAEESDSVEYFSFSMVNPTYEGIFDPIDPPELTEEEQDAIFSMRRTPYNSASAGGSAIRNYLKSRTTEFSVTYTDTVAPTGDRVWYIIDNYAMAHTGVATEGDYLYLQWSRYGGQASVSESGGTYTVTLYLEFEYLSTASEEKTVNTYVSNLLKQLNLSGKSDYEKIRGVYNWMCANISYDHEHLSLGSAYRWQFTAYGAIVDKTCVCQGYSVLFYRLMLELGVDARSITGYGYYVSSSQRHAWNIVELGGKYYNIDATWDAGVSPSNYQYFLRCPANFDGSHIRHNSSNGEAADRDYTSSSFMSKYPMATSDYRYVPAPSAPTLKSVSNVSNGVKITWNAVSGATSYDVYRKTGSSGWVKLNSTTSTSYVNPGVTSGTTYSYAVRARNSTGSSGYSSSLSIRHLSMPSVTSLSNGTQGINVRWKASAGANGYNVYRKSGSGSYTCIAVVRGSSNVTYTDTAVKNNNGTTYSYCVMSFYGSYKSATSSGVSLVRLGTPTLKSVSNVSNGVKITWNAISGATQYQIYRKTGSSGWVKLNTTTSTSYVNPGVTSGTTYTYTVRAVKGSSISYYNSTGLTIRHLSAPTVSVSNLHAGIYVNWKTTPGANGYNVYRKTGNGSYTRIAVIRGSSNHTYTDTAVQAKGGTTYTYQVMAFYGNYQSCYTTSKSIIRMDTPIIQSLTKSSSGVTVRWNSVSGCNGYNVYRKSANGSYVFLGNVKGSSASSFFDSSASGLRGTYTYKVQAYRGNSVSGTHTKSITL